MKKKYYEIRERLDFPNCTTSFDLGKTLFIVENKLVAADFCSRNNPLNINNVDKYFYVEKEFEIPNNDANDESDSEYPCISGWIGGPEFESKLNEIHTNAEIIKKETYDRLKVKGMIDDTDYTVFKARCESFDSVKDLVDEIVAWNDEDTIKDFLISLLY